MCIGVCSVKCENGCSSCTNTCGWWCDSSCNQQCFSTCDTRCISSCSGSCATYLSSDTTTSLVGPDRPPIANGYICPHPKNRQEERESFKLLRYPAPPTGTQTPPDPVDPPEPPEPPKPHALEVSVSENKDLIINIAGDLQYACKQTTLYGGVFTIDQSTGDVSVNTDALPGIIDAIEPNIDGGGAIFIIIVYYNPNYPFNDNDIKITLPFGFESLAPIKDANQNTIIIIQRDNFLFPGK